VHKLIIARKEIIGAQAREDIHAHYHIAYAADVAVSQSSTKLIRSCITPILEP